MEPANTASTKKRRRSTATDDAPSKLRATVSSENGAVQPFTETPTNGDKHSTLYTNPVDFKALALQDADFARFVKGRELDFSDPDAVRQLTKSLLKRDFGLHLDLPDDRLCPPVPNRHNYILFLKSLIDSTSPLQDFPLNVTGLDIGTGSSCIYPLLGAVQCGWSFYATDIDEKNLDFAACNVKANNLSERITLLRRKPEDDLIPELDGPITFCMTNPPFYTSQAQLEASASAKHDGPASVCTGAPVEMVTEGGEVAFVARILNESLHRKDDVQWYTAMLGFLSSVNHIVHLMRRGGITNWAVSELDQGSKTKRWVLAWSFGRMRPAEHVCRGVSNKGLPLPPPTEATISPSKSSQQTQKLISGLKDAVAQLDLLSWSWDSETSEGTGRAPGNVWNRTWRRKKKALEAEGRQMTHSQDDIFGFKVTVADKDGALAVHCRWLEGHAFVTFESFQGFIKTTLNKLVSEAGAQ